MRNHVGRRTVIAAGGAALGMLALSPRRARAAGPSLKVGVLTDMSGPYAADSGKGSVTMAQLAIEDFAKKHPEIKVELVSADFQLKPEVAVTIAGKWFDRDGVDVILDVPVSSAALAIADVVHKKNKVAILNPGTSELTGKACGPNHIHWGLDTYAMAGSTGKAVLAEGGKTWYFMAADYAFGQQLVTDASGIIKAGGGKVVGVVSYPFPNTTDFASYLLRAQSSGAKVLALASAGQDVVNAAKQATEFGISKSGTRLVALWCLISQAHTLGTAAAHGMLLTEAYYWDLNDGTRALAKRYAPKMGGSQAGSIQAANYSGLTHYLNCAATMGVEKAKASGAAAVAEMKKLPFDDPAFGKGTVREDGRAIYDVHLFEIKDAAQSKGPWDLYKLVRTTPGSEAFRPLDAGGCAMVHA